jgi:hypothetical protein
MSSAEDLIVAAVLVSKSGRPPIVVPITDAERNIEVELAYWAAVADRHPNGK